MNVETEMTGQELKDQVLNCLYEDNKEWMVDALATISNLTPGMRLIGEEIGNVVRVKIGPPAHSNVWGSLIRTAYKRGLIKPTGQYRPMIKRSSHARMSPEYLIPMPG